MVTAAEGPKRIVRDFKRRDDRRTVIRVGEVEIVFVPVVRNGKDTIQLLLPAGGRIEHINLTQVQQQS
jgi:hypothetical protein